MKIYRPRKWVKVVLIIAIALIPKNTSDVSATLTKTNKLNYVSAPRTIEIEPPVTSYTTRMTSYYSNDGYDTGSCTGSGLCESDFEVNDKGWYTYQGKLVIATATEYLLKYGFTLADGIKTYKYFDEITLNIDGVDYQAIVLDSCGSSMKNGRIDLFVSRSNAVKDTEIEVKEK